MENDENDQDNDDDVDDNSFALLSYRKLKTSEETCIMKTTTVAKVTNGMVVYAATSLNAVLFLFHGSVAPILSNISIHIIADARYSKKKSVRDTVCDGTFILYKPRDDSYSQIPNEVYSCTTLYRVTNNTFELVLDGTTSHPRLEQHHVVFA